MFFHFRGAPHIVDVDSVIDDCETATGDAPMRTAQFAKTP